MFNIIVQSRHVSVMCDNKSDSIDFIVLFISPSKDSNICHHLGGKRGGVDNFIKHTISDV